MKDMLEAIYALARGMSKPAGLDDKPTARLQAISLDNLRLGSDSRLDPIVYHTWKVNIVGSIKTMKLPEQVVLQLLRTKTHLPDRIKDTIQNATSMAELFNRIEQSVPELESAVSIVIKRICAQKHLSSQEPHFREARATELTLALQDLF